MSNNWFQFKQFRISQCKTAMKVGTDGVLLGAWLDIVDEKDNTPRVLDVGTGTGLIALMVAQRSCAEVFAIEIDKAAASQASDNFTHSPWVDRLNLIQADFKNIELLNLEKFDHIVCNPPFFSSSLNSPDDKRSIARHDDALPLSIFVRNCRDLITDEGKISLIFPIDRFEEAQVLLEMYGFFMVRKDSVRSRVNGKYIRVLSEWSLQKQNQTIGEISVYADRENVYTDQFRDLTKEFYLGYEDEE